MRPKVTLAVLVGLLLISHGGFRSSRDKAPLATLGIGMRLERLVPPGVPSLAEGGYQLLGVIEEDYGISQIRGSSRVPWVQWTKSPRPTRTKPPITVAGGTVITVSASPLPEDPKHHWLSRPDYR